MATQRASSQEPRAPLNRDRVLRAAIALADEAGIESLSMRKLGQALGVEAMSLYNHVANKDDILNAIVDIIESDIDLPSPGADMEDGPADDGGLGPRPLRATPVGGEPRVIGRPDPVRRVGDT